MKNKDQIMLEEAYKRVGSKTNAPSIFRDKKGEYIKHGDLVAYNSVTYKIVGGKTALGTGIQNDMLQLEPAEGTVTGEVPKLIWVRPKQVTKKKS